MRFSSVVIPGVLFVVAVQPAFAQEKPATIGTKTVAFLRFDIAQAPGEPIKKPDAEKLIGEINQFFKVNSRGKFQLDATIFPTLRLRRLRTAYAQNPNLVLEDARDVMKTAALHPEKYDLEIIATPRMDKPVAKGEVGKRGLMLQGEFYWRNVIQELSSNLGLYGSDVWKASNDSITGPGEAQAFKDPYDFLGDQKENFEKSVLNAPHKFQAGWLSEAEVPIASGAKRYKITPHDTAPATDTTSVKAVRIPLKNGGAYWLEYRPSIDSPRAKDGVLVYRTGAQPGPTQLLQMNPALEKEEGLKAALLLAGHVFNDKSLNVYITPLRAAENGPMEVAVNFGPFPGNQKPEVEIGADKWEVDVDQPLTLAGHATDPDGDEIAYWWEFGDGEWGGNTKKVTKTWKKPGVYMVKCHVSDLKDGVATHEMEVTVKGAEMDPEQPGEDGQPTPDGEQPDNPDNNQ